MIAHFRLHNRSNQFMNVTNAISRWVLNSLWFKLSTLEFFLDLRNGWRLNWKRRKFVFNLSIAFDYSLLRVKIRNKSPVKLNFPLSQMTLCQALIHKCDLSFGSESHFTENKKSPLNLSVSPFEKFLLHFTRTTKKSNLVHLFRHSWKVLIYWPRSEEIFTHPMKLKLIFLPPYFAGVLMKIFQTWRNPLFHRGFSICSGKHFCSLGERKDENEFLSRKNCTHA